MRNKIVIPQELMDLNKYTNRQRANRFGGNKSKRDQTNLCATYIRISIKNGLRIDSVPVKLVFHWYAKNRRKDPDNIAFAKKFILDGMTEAGLIPNDGWREIAGFEDKFYIDKNNPRVEIEVLDESK